MAVVLVVLFHAGVPAMSAGFVGVDVFFVLSGFLITGLLLREIQPQSRLSLSEFWAKRARRLLPAATVVILSTLVAGTALSSPLRWESLAAEAVASTGYVVNFYFGVEAQDYFAPAVELSPLPHMWSFAPHVVVVGRGAVLPGVAGLPAARPTIPSARRSSTHAAASPLRR